VIDSYGGDVYALLSMIDTIRACSIPVATIVEGKAMSCGAVLFSCGKEGHRYMGPNATVMIHDVSSWSQGKCEEVVADASEVQRLNQLVYQLMAKNCGHKDFNHFYDEISRRRGADWYLTAEECMSHKLANHTYIPSMKVKARLEWKFE
jgi:ATP-dependent Clp protease, protease subunit